MMHVTIDTEKPQLKNKAWAELMPSFEADLEKNM